MINGSSEYIALHAWIRRHKPRVDRCERCNCIPKNRIGKNGLVYNGLEVTNGGIYNKDFSNWEWLCRKCHYQKDREGWKVSEETKRKISLATKGKKRMDKRVIILCENCKREFDIPKGKLKKRPNGKSSYAGKFCGKECHLLSLKANRRNK